MAIDYWLSNLILISAPEEFILEAAGNLNILNGQGDL